MAGRKRSAKTTQRTDKKKQTRAVQKNDTGRQQPFANRTYKDSLGSVCHT